MSDIVQRVAKLNEPQQQAVKSDARHLLVLAGAGSGKTSVLTHRMAWLIESGQAAPHGTLAVTFTNKAAREMRLRLEELLPSSPHGMWIGTFHGIAHRLLKAHWRAAKLPENFQVMDSDDQHRLVKRIINELGLKDDLLDSRKVQWFINGQKDEGIRAQFVTNSYSQQDKLFKQIYVAYEALCERTGMVDFGELLLRAHELWLNNPPVLDFYQQQFQQVLVDEFQDTNSVQYAWLRVLCGDQVKLTVVGDDDQSIYGWRGAKVENIQQIQHDYPDTELVRLEQNYRSTGTILEAANAVIDNNTDRLGKELWTAGDKGDPIKLYAAFNEMDEARYIADSIESLLEQGTNASDIALLYRSNAQSRVLEEALIHLQIPYRIYGGVRFYERQEVRNLLSYLRLVASRNDDAAFERVVNVPARGIGAKSLENIRIVARDQGSSLWDAVTFMLQNGGLKGKAAGAVAAFQLLINQLDEASEDMTLSELCKLSIESSGLEAHYEKEGKEKAIARKENMQEVVNASKNYEKDTEGLPPLMAFLSEASLDAGDAQADVDEDSIHLMTLHSAKGLEFNQVFMAGLEENLFPHRMSMDSSTGLAEERRLCYVGITRARENLTLSYAEARRLFGSETRNRPSRFIQEIPDELVDSVRPTIRTTSTFASGNYGSSNSYRASKGGFSARNSDMGNALSEHKSLSLGSRVRHPMFGEGVIVSASGQGAHVSVTVAFEGEGVKELMLQYAKLEVI